MGGVGSLVKLFVQLIFYIDGFKNASRQPRFWGILSDLFLGVENGEFLLYRNFIFRRNNSKDKSASFLYVLGSYPSLYF